MSFFTSKLISPKVILISGFGLISLFAMSGCFQESKIIKTNLSTIEDVTPIESVAALGQLSPLGEVRRLAAPFGKAGGTPRVSQLFVEEGDFVKQGQLLAVFDNQPRISYDLEMSRSRYNTLQKNISMQRKEIARYKRAAFLGATPLVLLEEKENELITLEGQMLELDSRIKGLEADYRNTNLYSPLDGIILRIHTRIGERSASDGVLEVGANQLMHALVEVYESDISRIKIGQEVSIISENGGFKNQLEGNVLRISPQIRQRKVLSTDPTGDADARIVEVLVELSSESSKSVSHLTGIKVIARFSPL